jgi:hypothetical protein
MWQTEYPTIADVNIASLTTLDAWKKQLPTPETDVQRAVQRKIKKQLDLLMMSDLKKHAPELHDKLAGLHEKIDSVFGKEFLKGL